MPAQSDPRALSGVAVLCTGFTDHSAQQHVQQLLVTLGAVSAFSYEPSLRVDVMVALSVLTPDYQVALLCSSLLQ